MNINAIKFKLLLISDRSILSVFRDYQFHRVDTRHVLRDRISFCGRVSSPRCTLAIWARSTREKFIYLRFRRWPRKRFIHRVNRERGWTSETFLPSKQRDLHVRNVSSPSRRIERASRVPFPFFFRMSVSSSFVARCSTGCLLFRSGKRGRRFLRECTIHGNNT